MSYDNAFKRGQITLLIIMLIAGAAVGFAASLVVSRYFMDDTPAPPPPDHSIEALKAMKATPDSTSDGVIPTPPEATPIPTPAFVPITYRRANRNGKWFAVIREKDSASAFMIGTGRFDSMEECMQAMFETFDALDLEIRVAGTAVSEQKNRAKTDA